MTMPSVTPAWRVLIVSSHPLFRDGLRRVLSESQAAPVEIVGVAGTTGEALAALERLRPDLVVVDHDDRAVNRDEFLARFVEGESAMRLVLVSLREADRAVVYDRQTLAAARVEDWLGGLAVTGTRPAAPRSSQQPRRGSMRGSFRHFINVGVLVVIVTVIVSYLLDRIGLMPVQASTQAAVIDNLFTLHTKIISFLFALIIVFMVYSIVVFRRRPGETEDGDHFEGNPGLEVAWILLPLGAVLWFSGLGAQSLADIRRTDPQAYEVRVIASQWNWRFEYPDTGIVADALHLPVNRQVVLKMTSEDVIHSFWVPEFRVKQDALPGENLVRELRVTPSLVGTYKVRCAELCGTRHAYMENLVIVQSQADFDAWVQEQTFVSDDPVVRGQKWAAQFGCTACHSLDGTKIVGPTWAGLFGRQETLADGTSVVVDEAYLTKSILDPDAQVVQGFNAGIMPKTFAATLSEEQVADLVAYIKTLR